MVNHESSGWSSEAMDGDCPSTAYPQEDVEAVLTELLDSGRSPEEAGEEARRRVTDLLSKGALDTSELMKATIALNLTTDELVRRDGCTNCGSHVPGLCDACGW